LAQKRGGERLIALAGLALSERLLNAQNPNAGNQLSVFTRLFDFLILTKAAKPVCKGMNGKKTNTCGRKQGGRISPG
jgi:hypothetical protein